MLRLREKNLVIGIEYNRVAMAWTQETLDNLDEAIASGATTIMDGGKMTTFRSAEDMVSLRNLIFAHLNPSSVQARKNYYDYDRGY